MQCTRWAILGPGTISGDFARSLVNAEHGTLRAVGSSNSARAAAFAKTHNAPATGTYDHVLARDDVDAVYIGTVHTTHASLSAAALAAGKAVLCEKPLSPTLDETTTIIETARAAGLPFVEAFKYRFGPLAAMLHQLIASGAIGRVERLETSIGFEASTREGRLFDPALAGGAILDAGGYPASLVIGVAAWAAGGETESLDPRASVASVRGEIGPTGVDEWAEAEVTAGGIVASIRTSIISPLPRSCTVYGTEGTIHVPNVWGSRSESAAELTLSRTGESARRIEPDIVDPMAAEADAVSLALAEGRSEVPQMPWAQSLATAGLLADWRSAVSG